jgi:2,3-dihydroxybiphenyl 1,2-dioxygenase
MTADHVMTADPAIELAYLGLEIADPTTLDHFLTNVIGLAPGELTESGAHTYRNDDRVRRLIVHQGPADDARYLGFEVADADSLATIVDRLHRMGAPVEIGGPADLSERAVAGLARTTTPWGLTLEIVHGLARADRPFQAALVPGGFLTEHLGFGHAVFAVPDLGAAVDFLGASLGMAQSDWIETDMGGLEMEIRFLHCNGRHHTIALAGVPFELPQRLHHIMFETNTLDDVGAAFDRAMASGLPIPNGLGKHDNDRVFSFYVQSPAGFQVEIGHGSRLITAPWPDDHAYDRISRWGHQPVVR